MSAAARPVAVAMLCGLALVPSLDMLRAEEAADAFDCAACHPMKIRDFNGRRADPITPVEEYPELPTGTQNVASSPAMCFSCHDGFVMDSRFAWKDGEYRGHPLGMSLPADMPIPEIDGDREFPLNEDGNVYCGTCHSAHLNAADGEPASVKPFMRQSAAGGQICAACHADKTSIIDSVHDKSGRRTKDFESRGICGTCHAPHGSDRPVMWAREFGQAELELNRLCRSCHEDDPMPGEHPPAVVAWSQDLRAGMRSRTPVAMPVFDDEGHQAPVGHIGCATCHDVHRERASGRAEDLPGLYLRLPEVVEPLCADCHGPESLFLYKFFHSQASRQ